MSVEALTAVIDYCARTGSNTYVGDIGVTFDKNSGKSFLNDDQTISRDVMPDFLHLSRKGYRIWADSMEPTLWSMLDEPR